MPHSFTKQCHFSFHFSSSSNLYWTADWIQFFFFFFKWYIKYSNACIRYIYTDLCVVVWENPPEISGWILKLGFGPKWSVFLPITGGKVSNVLWIDIFHKETANSGKPVVFVTIYIMKCQKSFHVNGFPKPPHMCAMVWFSLIGQHFWNANINNDPFTAFGSGSNLLRRIQQPLLLAGCTGVAVLRNLEPNTSGSTVNTKWIQKAHVEEEREIESFSWSPSEHYRIPVVEKQLLSLLYGPFGKDPDAVVPIHHDDCNEDHQSDLIKTMPF